jgi:hypothetical protein
MDLIPNIEFCDICINPIKIDQGLIKYDYLYYPDYDVQFVLAIFITNNTN